MKLDTVLKRLRGWYEAEISVYLRSPPGRGKTETLCAASSILSHELQRNLGHVVISGPLLTPADAVGYLVPKHMENGHAESLFTDPFWFRTRDGRRLDEYDGGIIIVDEADKMDTDVKKVIGEAALSRRLGPHTLAGGWVVWMAGNRASDRSGSTKELDHLINRRMELDVTDDLQSLINWMNAQEKILPVTKAFTQQNPQVVFSEAAPDKQGPWCTPRSLVKFDSYLQLLAPDGRLPDDPDVIEEASGMIGAGAGAQFFTFVRLEREMPSFESIVKDPMKVKVPDKPDAQMLVCYNLAHRIDKDTARPVVAYMERFPKEFAVTFATAAIKRDPMLVMTPAFQKWALANASLMALINQ